jgi:hypothetical protein
MTVHIGLLIRGFGVRVPGGAQQRVLPLEPYVMELIWDRLL